MGLGLFGSSSASRSSSKRASGGGQLLLGDPNPERFEILTIEQRGRHVVAEIRYPDASNYEGRKLAVYRATPGELRSAKRLDPHFSEKTGALVPIARFEPTAMGWALAREVCMMLARDAGR